MKDIQKTKRLPGLDIVRSLAILFVVAQHFNLNTEFRQTVFDGTNLFFQGMCASIFFVAVPLFLLLTGYLNINKHLSFGYYKGIVRVLEAYLIYSLLAIAYRYFVNGEHLSVLLWIRQILNYEVIPYGWYIEMYICLFLLIPFLNLIYKCLDTQRKKQILIVTFLALTAIPISLNWSATQLFPAYFTSLYPVSFYFIGAYIHEYKPKFRKLWLCVILIILCTVDPVFNSIVHLREGFVSLFMIRNGLFNTITAVIVFLLFYDVDFKSKMITKISLLSLDMYLCSWIFDNLYYTYFKAHYFESQQQFFAFFPIIVPLVFFSSFGVAWLREKVNWGIKKIL